ncbi:unnamed protein product, partial [Staurois parvus]
WGPQAIGDHGAPVSLPKLKKAYEKGTRGISWGPLVPEFPNEADFCPVCTGLKLTVCSEEQGRTDNSWGPRAIGIMGPLCPCPNSKKPMKKVPGASHGAPTDPGPSGSA